MPAERGRASERVQHEWLRRVEAEYGSAAVTQHLTLWLIQLGAPPVLIRAGLRVVRDELAHAELSHVVYRHAGGKAQPSLQRETLGLARTNASLEIDTLQVTLRVFCLGETAAVRLFTRMRAQASVAPAKRTLDRILRDEVRHRELGWDLLAWLLSTRHEAVFRANIAATLPLLLDALKKNYGARAPEARTCFPESERAWGLIPHAEYVTAVQKCIDGDCKLRLARLQIPMP